MERTEHFPPELLSEKFKSIDESLNEIKADIKSISKKSGLSEKMLWVASGAVLILAPLTYWVATRVILLGDQVTQIASYQQVLEQNLNREIDSAVNTAFATRINHISTQ